MNQAIERAEADYGDIDQWDKWERVYETDDKGNKTEVPNIEYFEKYIKPYISYTNIQYASRLVIVYFADGSLATFSSLSVTFYPYAKDYSLTKKENGDLVLTPEYSGTKVFIFFFNPTENSSVNKYHYKRGVEPYKWNWDGNRDTLLNDPSIGCKKEVSNTRAYCTALIQINGWKIPKDYPLSF